MTVPPRLWPPLAVLLALHLGALAAGFLAPHDPLEHHRDLALHPPALDAAGHCFLLGTDRYGRDLLSRLLHGARPSLAAGLLAGLLAVGVGVAAGTLAGFAGGLIDGLVMRTAELFQALPWLYLLLAARAFLPLDVAPLPAFLALATVLGLVGWSGPAKLARGVALAARAQPFVEAARGFGASGSYLLWRHVVPAAMPVALTQLALLVPRYVVAEVALSFLGLGVAEPAPSWGNLLAELRDVTGLAERPWTLAPALALAAVVLSYHRLASEAQRLLGPEVD